MSFLFHLIAFVRLCVDSFIDYIFSFYYNTPKKVPKISNPLLVESATSLARRIREQQITSEDLVKLFIGRIKEVNPLLNAVVNNRFDVAIAEAKEIDTDIRNKTANFDGKPFLGVPFTAKDTSLCKGMVCTFGLVSRKDVVAEEDADIVLALKRAGGILLGNTNVPELGMWHETDNTLYGTTNNPYNTTRNVGGSSGGEAAIIAACGSPIGIGTDIGGSIRIPAFMCGLFGHKPTNGLISTKGMGFRRGNEGPTMVTAGPMTKYSEDLIPFLKVLVGNKVNELKLDESVNVGDLNIYYVTNINNPFVSRISNEMKDALERTVQHFGKNFKRAPQQLQFAELDNAMTLWRYWLTHEKGSNFLKDITNRKGEINPFWELLKFIIRTSTVNAYTLMYSFSFLVLPTPNEQWALETTNKLKSALLAKLGTNGVLLYPSSPFTARYHFTSLFRPLHFAYFAIWNVLKMPSTQVPLGLSKDGLPIGIQVVAAPNQDHLCIAVAKELEKAFGGYVPPNVVAT